MCVILKPNGIRSNLLCLEMKLKVIFLIVFANANQNFQSHSVNSIFKKGFAVNFKIPLALLNFGCPVVLPFFFCKSSMCSAYEEQIQLRLYST